MAGQMRSFHCAMAETGGSGVPVQKTLCHREAVQPFFEQGSRWEPVSATTICSNFVFDMGFYFASIVSDFSSLSCFTTICEAAGTFVSVL